MIRHARTVRGARRSCASRHLRGHDMTTEAEPSADAPPGTLITGFVHAQINVSDLERSIPFYEMLGFEVISKGTIKDPGIFAALGLDGGTRMRGAFLRIPGRSTKVTPMLDMIQFVDPPPAGRALPGAQPPRDRPPLLPGRRHRGRRGRLQSPTASSWSAPSASSSRRATACAARSSASATPTAPSSSTPRSTSTGSSTTPGSASQPQAPLASTSVTSSSSRPSTSVSTW